MNIKKIDTFANNKFQTKNDQPCQTNFGLKMKNPIVCDTVSFGNAKSEAMETAKGEISSAIKKTTHLMTDTTKAALSDLEKFLKHANVSTASANCSEMSFVYSRKPEWSNLRFIDSKESFIHELRLHNNGSFDLHSGSFKDVLLNSEMLTESAANKKANDLIIAASTITRTEHHLPTVNEL